MFFWLKPASKRPHRNSVRRKPLHLESLEARSLLAGVVDVSISGATLFVRGDGLSNGLMVVATEVPGQFHVVGVPNLVTTYSSPEDEAETLIRFGDGTAESFLVNNVKNIYANLGNGNDQFAVLGEAAAPSYMDMLRDEYTSFVTHDTQPFAFSGATATLGGSIFVLGGNGNDAVSLLVNTTGSITLDTGAGHDYVVIKQTSTTSLIMNTGAGDTATQGADRVRVQNLTAKGVLAISTYRGDDSVSISNSKVPIIAINTGENGGNPYPSDLGTYLETVGLIGITSQAIGINTGGGDDMVLVGPMTDAEGITVPATIGTLAISTADGIDQVHVLSVSIGQSLLISTGQGADHINFGRVDAGSALIDTGSGDDVLLVAFVKLQIIFYAILGDGNDSGYVTESSAAVGIILGMAGADDIHLDDNTGIIYVP